ncbi:MAG: serine/threonine-protein kinase [Polyangiaceae bacterium]
MLRDPLRLRIGQKLGRYELLAPVARGGMGQVWAARQRGARGFHKLVAIKTLSPAEAAADSALMEQRLLDEAGIAALIQHSNVVQTLELGEHQGQLYLVMEWVDGEPLEDLIESTGPSGGLPLLVAVNLVAQVLRGLQAAHELKDDAGVPLGIVHKELSPHNVLVSYAGTAKIVDFGIAKAMNEGGASSSDAEDKAAYQSPEQILGGVVDQRSDLFAVGVLLYELTTGRHPFPAANTPGTLRNSVSEEPALRPSRLVPNYSRTLEAVVLKALEKDRDRRWPSAEEMRLALQRGVPQAFELGFESQLGTFMMDTVGDRAVRRREALRRAELVVDAGGADETSGSSSVSATSLRGIAIDTDPSRSAPPLPTRSSRLPSLRPLLARSVPPPHLRRPLLLAFSALVAVVGGLLWLRSPVRSANTVATAPGSGMVDLSPPRAPSPAPHVPASSAPPLTSASAPAAVPAATPSAFLAPRSRPKQPSIVQPSR